MNQDSPIARHLEDSLATPLSEVLQGMQDRLMAKSTYGGIRTLKNPVDFWMYQEIIHEMKPDFIIEIGNHRGGSALAFAHWLDQLGHGQVIAVDLSHEEIAREARDHPRITFLEGAASELHQTVADVVGESAKVIVIEDSSHEFDNTLEILRLYSCLVSVGSYFIVEDGICHHGLEVGPAPGPYEAVHAFLEENQDFEIDRGREDFLITWNPCGYLRRIR